MLVARERFDSYHLPEQYGKMQPQARKIRKISTRTKVVYCAVVMVAICLSFLLTARFTQIASIGYEIVSLKKQAQELDVQNQALQNKIDEMKSLKNIEHIATNRLGMQKPELAGGVQFVPVEYSKAGPGESTVGSDRADSPGQKPSAPQRKNSLVQALAKLING